MAKITKIEFRHERLTKPVEAHVEFQMSKQRYAVDTGFFFVRIEDEYLGLRDLKQWKDKIISCARYSIGIKGKDVAEAKKNWLAYMEDWVNSSSKSEKVILYRMQFDSKNLHSTDEQFHKDESGLAQIVFDYAVCEKKTFGGATSYYRMDYEDKTMIGNARFSELVSAKTGGYEEWICLEYTPEAEEFFKSIYSGMEMIMGKFEKHLGTKKSIIKTIESKTKLLA